MVGIFLDPGSGIDHHGNILSTELCPYHQISSMSQMTSGLIMSHHWGKVFNLELFKEFEKGERRDRGGDAGRTS